MRRYERYTRVTAERDGYMGTRRGKILGSQKIETKRRGHKGITSRNAGVYLKPLAVGEM